MERVMKKMKTSLSSLMIPLIALGLLVLFNVIRDLALGQWNFLNIYVNDGGALDGTLISILKNASAVAIIGMGMTLVTASCGGQDISVGTVSAIAGAAFCKMLYQWMGSVTVLSMIASILFACLVTIVFKLFNGTLIAVFKIQPMIATLILYSCGRQVASWIIGEPTTVIGDEIVQQIGRTIPGVPLPTPILITLLMGIILLLVFKFTNLRLYTQSVGINQGASRLNGINPVMIKLLSFVVLGVCVTLASVIQIGKLGTFTQNTILADVEMDVILAVAIGGNNLGGGKFSITGTVLGAYTIETLMNTLRAMNVDTSDIKAYKAIAIIAVVVAASPVVKEKLTAFWKWICLNSRKLFSKEAA